MFVGYRILATEDHNMNLHSRPAICPTLSNADTLTIQIRLRSRPYIHSLLISNLRNRFPLPALQRHPLINHQPGPDSTRVPTQMGVVIHAMERLKRCRQSISFSHEEYIAGNYQG